MSQPFFTVITVCYNAMPFVERAINSVLGQSFRDFEYLVYDGQSSDGTLEALHKFRKRVNELVSEPDRNMYDALNKAIRRSNGRYIVILNSDDQLEPNALRNAWAQMNENPGYDVYVGKTKIVDETTGVTKYRRQRRQWPIALGMPFDHQACIVSKQTYDAVGLYNVAYHRVADYDFLIRALSANRTFFLLKTDFNIFYRGGMSSFRRSYIDIYKILRTHGYGVLTTSVSIIFRFILKMVVLLKKVLSRC